MKTLERVPDLLGYLVLNEEGAILSSSGELENSESAANVFITILGLADRLITDEPFKKLTFVYPHCSYTVCLSNRKLYIVKRRYQPPPMPISLGEEISGNGDS